MTQLLQRLHNWMGDWQQWKLPPEFRIEGDSHTNVQLLATGLRSLAAELHEKKAPSSSAPGTSENAQPSSHANCEATSGGSPRPEIQKHSPNTPDPAQKAASNGKTMGKEPGPPDESPAQTPIGSLAAMDAGFATAVCNGYFRLVRNVAQLEDVDADSRPLRGIRRALENLNQAMTEQQIECIDPTGEKYDPTRGDIEIIGAPEERDEIQMMMVELTERPIVFLNGRIIQRARAVIIKPRV